MNLFHFLLSEVSFYWVWWLCFGAVAYISARKFGWFGLLGSAAFVAALTYIIEFQSVFHDMRNHPQSGRDADMIFMFGTLCRMILYSIVSAAVGLVGIPSRGRRKP